MRRWKGGVIAEIERKSPEGEEDGDKREGQQARQRQEERKGMQIKELN